MRRAIGLAIPLALFGTACGSRAIGKTGSLPDACAADTGTGSLPDDDAGAPDSGLLGPWKPTADYPLAAKTCTGSAPNQACADQTCVARSGHVTCVGGGSNATYVSALDAAGPGPWTRSTDYPIAASGQSCVLDANFIYCVGGGTWGVEVAATASAYFAPLSATGVGPWAATTALPTAGAASCVASAGYIYCLSDTPHYAPLTACGIGTWAPTQGPPTRTAACTAAGGYIYCFGGGNCAPLGPGDDCESPSYYAPLTANGIGAWKTTTPLPTVVSAKAVSAGPFLYYLSIPVFTARVSASGIGPWETTTNYPHSLYPSSCFSTADHVYCASPEASSSYFAQLGVANPSGLHLVNPPPAPRAEYLMPAFAHGSGAAVTTNGVTVGVPRFGRNIDDAVVFDCATAAATSSGCQATVISPENMTYNYDLTIWYPCADANTATTNCCFLPKIGYPTPFNAWCASTDTGSFIITQAIDVQ